MRTALVTHFFVFSHTLSSLSAMALAKATVVYPPNSNLILIDSAYRGIEQEPYNFAATFSSGIRGKQIAYDGIAWSQPFFTHNAKSSELIFEIETVPPQPEPLVIYATPWIIWKNYDGNVDTAFYQPPFYGSYGYNIETLLNTDIRLLSANTILYTPLNGGNPITFFFRYSSSGGYTFFARDAATLLPLRLRLLPCRWLDYAHRVHGFGKYDALSDSIIPESDQFAVSIRSAVHPNLVYTRYIYISCPELAQNRTYDSLLSGFSQPRFNMEVGVFATPIETAGVFHTDRATGDQTKIHLKTGVEPRVITMIMSDEEGEIISCGNPLEQFFADVTIPTQYQNNLLYPPYYISTPVTNILALGKSFPPPILPPLQTPFPTYRWSCYQFLPVSIPINMALNENVLNNATFSIFPLQPNLQNVFRWNSETALQYNYSAPYQLIRTKAEFMQVVFPMSFNFTSKPSGPNSRVYIRLLTYVGDSAPNPPLFTQATRQSLPEIFDPSAAWPAAPGQSPNLQCTFNIPYDLGQVGDKLYFYVAVSILTTADPLTSTLYSMQGPYNYSPLNAAPNNQQSYLFMGNPSFDVDPVPYVNPEANYRYVQPDTKALCEDVIHLMSCKLE